MASRGDEFSFLKNARVKNSRGKGRCTSREPRRPAKGRRTKGGKIMGEQEEGGTWTS